MPMGTKWKVTFETAIPVGDIFIDGALSDGIGDDENNKPVARNVKVECLRELTDAEYKKYDADMKALKDGGIIN